MATVTIKNLRDRVKGTTFKSVQFTLQDNAGAPITVVGATIEADFRYRTKLGAIVKSIDTVAGITITDGANGVFEFDEFTPVDWEVDCYWYGIRITFATGKIGEYVQGTVKILQSVPD